MKTDKKIEIKEFEERFAVLLEKWKLSPDFSYEYLIKETSNMVTNLLNTEVQKAREEAVRGFADFLDFRIPEVVDEYLQSLKDKQ